MLVLIRLVESARRQKVRSNSGLSQRDLLDSGIDIMETNGELYSDQKEKASRRTVEAQLYAAGLPPCPPFPSLPPSPSFCVFLLCLPFEPLQYRGSAVCCRSVPSPPFPLVSPPPPPPLPFVPPFTLLQLLVLLLLACL